MKKYLLICSIFFYSFLISYNSYGIWTNSYDEWVPSTICIEKEESQNRNGLIFLPNKTQPFTGTNLCKYSNGQIKIKGKIKQGKLTDKWFGWFENGQLEYETNYRNGVENGKWIFWFPNGKIKTIKNFKLGEFDGIWSGWYENGNKWYEKNFVYGDAEGTWSTWLKDGKINQVSNYKNGIKDGKWSNWHLNGKIKSEVNYTNGTLNGKWTGWDRDGNLNIEENYDNGLQVICIETDIQYRDGIIYLPYDSAPFSGLNVCNDQDNQLKLIGKIKNGKLEGEWNNINKNGKIIKKSEYNNGVCISGECL